jgi:hypothetical protein
LHQARSRLQINEPKGDSAMKNIRVVALTALLIGFSGYCPAPTGVVGGNNSIPTAGPSITWVQAVYAWLGLGS